MLASKLPKMLLYELVVGQNYRGTTKTSKNNVVLSDVPKLNFDHQIGMMRRSLSGRS